MRAFTAMTAAALRQLLGGRRLLWLGLPAAALPAVILALVLTQETTAIGARRAFHEAPIGILLFVVLPLVSLVFGAAALGDERRDQTLSFLLLRPRPRCSITAAKLLAAWAASFLVAGTAAAAMGLVLGLDGAGWDPLGPLVLACALATLCYVSVYLVLGYLTSRAVLIGLAYLFVWETGFTAAIESLAPVSLFRIGLSAYVAEYPLGMAYLDELLGSVRPGTGGAVAKAVVLALAAVMVLTLLLRNRDIT